MAEKPQSNGSNAVGRSPVEHHSQASQAAPLPPSQMSQLGGTRGTARHNRRPEFGTGLRVGEPREADGRVLHPSDPGHPRLHLRPGFMVGLVGNETRCHKGVKDA